MPELEQYLLKNPEYLMLYSAIISPSFLCCVVWTSLSGRVTKSSVVLCCVMCTCLSGCVTKLSAVLCCVVWTCLSGRVT